MLPIISSSNLANLWFLNTSNAAYRIQKKPYRVAWFADEQGTNHARTAAECGPHGLHIKPTTKTNQQIAGREGEWRWKVEKGCWGGGDSHRAERSNNLFCILFYFHFECTADIRTEAFVELVNVSHPKAECTCVCVSVRVWWVWYAVYYVWMCVIVCVKCSFCESNKSAAIKMPSIAKCNNNNSNKQQLKRWLTLTLWRCQYLQLVPVHPLPSPTVLHQQRHVQLAAGHASCERGGHDQIVSNMSQISRKELSSN